MNYHSLFGCWTDHMKLLFNVAKFVSPNGFVLPDERKQFDAVLPKINKMTLSEYLNPDMWDDPLINAVLPNLSSERAEDLQDTRSLYSAKNLGHTKRISVAWGSKGTCSPSNAPPSTVPAARGMTTITTCSSCIRQRYCLIHINDNLRGSCIQEHGHYIFHGACVGRSIWRGALSIRD